MKKFAYCAGYINKKFVLSGAKKLFLVWARHKIKKSPFYKVNFSVHVLLSGNFAIFMKTIFRDSIAVKKILELVKNDFYNNNNLKPIQCKAPERNTLKPQNVH